MFLEQIERRLEALMQNQQEHKREQDRQERAAKRNDPTRAKTIGVKVEPELYAQLVQIKERHGLNSLKEALLLAASCGINEALTAGSSKGSR